MAGQRGPVPIVDAGPELAQQILDLLESQPTIDTDNDFASHSHSEIKAALDRLDNRSMIQYDTKDREQATLTPEAELICKNGSHEYRVWDIVRQKGKVSIKELPGLVGADAAKVGQNTAFRNKWIKKDGDGLVMVADDIKDGTREALENIRSQKTPADSKSLADFKKRKLITLSKQINYIVRKGPKYSRQMPVEATELTSDMLANGTWKSTSFKSYNFAALGANQNAGALHPLNKVRSEFRQLFFNQGFVEMPTSRYVESGFWNFDALFVPQQHPARDLQDTFYISDPKDADGPRADPDFEATMNAMEASSRKLFSSLDDVADPPAPVDNTPSPAPPIKSPKSPKSPRMPKSPTFRRKSLTPSHTTTATDTKATPPASQDPPAKPTSPSPDHRDYTSYMSDVKSVHEGGSFGSIGYRYPWSSKECLRLCLRTHTTAVSAWVLHRLALNPRPARYFSIDRVFRNESLDATHLAEFHQVEGVIADYGLTLGGLQLFLQQFFAAMGISNLRFKPAYNPYTEPSMEIFGYHDGLARWVEIGNSGMFRPEMLEPMGLPPSLRVYGFGLSLERPTMIKYGVSNIRALLGHKVDLGFVEANPAVRLDRD